MTRGKKLKFAAVVQLIAMCVFVSAAAAFECTPGERECEGYGPDEVNPGFFDWWVEYRVCNTSGQWGGWQGFDMSSADNMPEAQDELNASMWMCEHPI